ncbi:MAG: hypothetical protein P1U40_10185 [Coxiellaceae bacterium]|nr:hypothetical protein [Coxiellaceae bacterium]
MSRQQQQQQQQQQQVEQIIQQMQDVQAQLRSPDRIIPEGARAGEYLASFNASLGDVVGMLQQLKAGETILVADFTARMDAANMSVSLAVNELNQSYAVQFPSLCDKYPGLSAKVSAMAAMSEEMFGKGSKKGRRRKSKPATAADPLLHGAPAAAQPESSGCCLPLCCLFGRKKKAVATSGGGYSSVGTARTSQLYT